MKKSELQRIIKEEIQNILKEGNVFPMWEDDKEEVEGTDDKDKEKEANDSEEINESIKQLQKLAGIITEEYGISTKEAKSNDYYKKGMMSEEDSDKVEITKALTTKKDYGQAFVPTAAQGVLHILSDFKLKEKMKGLAELLDDNQYMAIEKLYNALYSEVAKYSK